MMHVFVLRADAGGPPRVEEYVSNAIPIEIDDGHLFEVIGVDLPPGASMATLLRRAMYGGGRKARGADARLERHAARLALVRRYLARRVASLSGGEDT